MKYLYVLSFAFLLAGCPKKPCCKHWCSMQELKQWNQGEIADQIYDDWLEDEFFLAEGED